MEDILGREFIKGGANIHVKSHYRVHNGKLVYVHDHEKAMKTGTEAQLHERVRHGKNGAHLLTIDPEDRDTVLKHAGQLGIKPHSVYQGSKIHDEEGNSKAHGFHILKFNSEDEAKKVHASITSASKGEEVDTPAAKEEAALSNGDPDGKEYPGTGKQEGVTMRVVKMKDGRWSVTMKDDDSGKVFPAAKIFKPDQEDAAHAYAKKVAAGKNPDAGLDTTHAEPKSEEKPAEEPKGEAKPEPDLTPNPDTSGKIPNTLSEAMQKKVDAYIDVAKDAIANGKPMEEVLAIIKEKSGFGPVTMKNLEEALKASAPKKKAKHGDYTAAEWTKHGEEMSAHAETTGSSQQGDAYADAASYYEAAAKAHDADGDHDASAQATEKAKELAKKAVGSSMIANSKLDAMHKLLGTEKEPKAAPVSEEYAKKAKEATEASADAHEETKGLKAGQLNGDHTPDKAESTMLGHAAAGNKHMKAKVAHLKAADKAPTPELAKFHEQKAEEHENHGKVHASAMEMQAKQHKKNQLQDVYDTEATKADVESQTANDLTKDVAHTESPESHSEAASFHDSAAKAHTNMIQHALSAGGVEKGDKMANEHAAKATEHQKKAAYHKAASEAWKATNEGDHGKAAQAHGAANYHAEQAGMTEQAAKHMEAGKKHSEEAFKQKAASEKTSDYEKKHAHAHQSTTNANASDTYDNHVAAAEAHYEAHKAAKEAHGEDSPEAKGHLILNEFHGNKANEIHEKENGKAAAPASPYVGKDHNGPASKAYEAEKKGDIASAISHYKDAAVYAHHNGDAEAAKKYVMYVKDLQKQSTQKAVDTEEITWSPQALVVAIQSAAVQVHQEKQQVRNLLKAVDTMPSFAKLQGACAKATKSGITDIHKIVEHALGGKKTAAPYLAFLAGVNQ